MCQLITTRYMCDHHSTFKGACQKVRCNTDAFGDCGKVIKEECFDPYHCRPRCVYRVWRRRWVCHKCNGPNQKASRCAIKRCGHIICSECKPLVRPRKGGARTTKYNALEHIKWSGIAKSATRLPPVPLYNPSVGD
ncbi:hypothetical protein CGRA01v4_14261 [Colletotrichum graminicola]|nr:hypothetical protein CGRA01v4_14261 [Colletotrichum graminicola]